MASSFSSAAKAEVCRILPQKHCCALAECFGVLLFANNFSADGIKIITESRDFAYILPKLFKKAFDLSFDSYPSLASPGKLVFQIWDSDKIETIMEAFGFDAQDTLALHVNLPVVEEDCCKASFLRGAFLAGGSVTDPGKGYHMELVTTHQSVARETDSLMREVMGFYKLPPEKLIVLVDDVELPLGSLRIRSKGSAGTHNGLRSILSCLGSDNFVHIRIGCGQDQSLLLRDFVLKRPGKGEMALLEEAYAHAAEAAELIVSGHTDRAQMLFNKKHEACNRLESR